MQEFEEWAQLLLLDALQRTGFFTQSSPAISLADLQSRVPAGYARFMAEATAMLEISGKHPVMMSALDIWRGFIVCTCFCKCAGMA